MKSLKVTNRFNTLAEAVAFAKPDLSYNPRLAAEEIKMADSGFNGRSRGVTHAFVTEDNKIHFVYENGGIGYLHEFSPFSACLHDGSLTMVCWDKIDSLLKWTEIRFEKNAAGNSAARKLIQDIMKCAATAPQIGGVFAN
jgi:hypothetical protein